MSYYNCRHYTGKWSDHLINIIVVRTLKKVKDKKIVFRKKLKKLRRSEA